MINGKILLFLIIFAFSSAFAVNWNACPLSANSAGTTYDQTANVATTGTCVTASAANVVIDCHGFTIDGDNVGTDNAITASSVSGVTFKNCVITDFSTPIRINDADSFTVQNVTTSGQSDGTASVVRILLGSDNTKITQSTFGSNSAARTIFQDGTGTGLNISNNTFSAFSSTGIELGSSGTGALVNNNTFTGLTGSATVVLATSGAATISNNNFATSARTGNGIRINGASSSVISGNNFTNWASAANPGIGIDSGTGVTVSGNTLINWSNIPIKAATQSNIISSNIITNSGASSPCISLTAGLNNVSSNFMSNCTTEAILINDGTNANINVTSNTAENLSATAIGIHVQAGNITANNNFIRNSTIYLKQDVTTQSRWNNTALGYNSTVGITNFSAFNSAAAFNATEGVNVRMQPQFISVDDSALTLMNVSAAITLETDSSCVNRSIFVLSGFPSTRAAILAGTSLGWANCASGIANFNVAGFSGYALGAIYNFAVSLANANETEIRAITATITGQPLNITDYNITINYNNTLVLSYSATGINQLSVANTTNVVSPLVNSNPTNIPWNVSVAVTINGTTVNSSLAGNQAVSVWYDIATYNMSHSSSQTIEEQSITNIAIPGRPGNATQDVTYNSYNYFLDKCDDIWARAATNATNTTTCNPLLLSINNMSLFTRLPSHRQEQATIGGSNGSLVQTNYFLTRSMNLSFNQTPESTSAKTISASNSSLNNDTYIWLVNAANGFPYPITSAGVGTLINSSIFDETSNASITADSYAGALQVRFADGTNKSYNIGYSSTANTTIKVFPTIGSFKIFRYEEFLKASYTTRRMIYADFLSFNTTYNHSIYLLSFSNPGAVSVEIIIAGFPTASFVRVYKLSGFSNLHLDDRYLDNNFQTFGIYIQDAFYTVYVYDSEGNLLASQGNMQVDCSISCRLVISGTNLNTTIFNPFNYLIRCDNIVDYGGANDSLRNKTPSSGYVNCTILENPGNYTFTLRNIVNQSVICTNTTINASMTCAFNVTQNNIWQVLTSVNNQTYVVAAGSFMPPNQIIFGKDGAILWILASVAMTLFLWNNMIMAGIFLAAFISAGNVVNIVPNELAMVGALAGILIFAGGIFKRKAS